MSDTHPVSTPGVPTDNPSSTGCPPHTALPSKLPPSSHRGLPHESQAFKFLRPSSPEARGRPGLAALPAASQGQEYAEDLARPLRWQIPHFSRRISPFTPVTPLSAEWEDIQPLSRGPHQPQTIPAEIKGHRTPSASPGVPQH